ncbi:Alpha-1,2-galactosyltransferase gmh3 [Yarrowia sp. C11]|nr:Alpha-1,2-galactosyltransferase gmh3 [Yarrowia sp. E02]KAG5371814.1 Alpha-1,2-galactosyltransferase gmh3 [Yarrowia sp. C11]
MIRRRFSTTLLLLGACVCLLFLAASQSRLDLDVPSYHGYKKTVHDQVEKPAEKPAEKAEKPAEKAETKPDSNPESKPDSDQPVELIPNTPNTPEDAEKEKKKAENQAAEDDKKKAEDDKKEEEKRLREEEKNGRIDRLAEDEEQFKKIEAKLKNAEEKAKAMKEELEEARKRKDERRKKAQEQKSQKLQGVFHKLEGEEIGSIVNKPLTYTEQEKVDGHVQPYGSKIALLSASNGKTDNEMAMLELVLPNRQEYCNYHGYICAFVDLNTIDTGKDHVVWAKMGAIQRVFNEHPEVEWVWWMDTDIFLMNPEIELGEHLLSDRALVERLTYARPIRKPDTSFAGEVYPSKENAPKAENLNLLLSQDFFGINAGSFFIKRSPWTDMLLDLWYDPVHVEKNYIFKEQEALNNLIRGHKSILSHTGIYPQRLFNSYTGQPNDVWTYKEGDLALHLAGCNHNNDCEKHLTGLFPKRGRVPEKFRESGLRVDFGDKKKGN